MIVSKFHFPESSSSGTHISYIHFFETLDVEGQYQQEQSVLQEEIEEVRRTLQEETDSRKDAEADIARNEQEMRREKEETTRARAAAHERLQDKQSEIEKLRSQVKHKAS